MAEQREHNDEQPGKEPRRQRRRRSHGEGSVFELKGRDRKKPWVAQVTLESGKKKQTYHVTQQEAIAARRKMLNELEQGKLITAKDQTAGQFLEYWLEEVHKPAVRLHTYVSYRRFLDNHILPEIGHIPLRRLTAEQVQALYSHKLKEGLSPKSISVMHGLLHTALAQAVRWRRVSYNVCDDVRPPRLIKREAHSLNPEQAQKLLEAAKGHRLEVLLTLAITTGMRRGEIVGLKWQDIDFETRSLHVCRTVDCLGGYGFTVSEPKTATGKRKISLPHFVIAMFKEHRAHQLEARLKAGPAWEDHDIVFCDARGRFLDPNYLHRLFQQFLMEAGLLPMRFHDLRHSAATILLSMGVNPKVIQELLGHSRISVTLDIYSHVLPGMQDEAMGKWDDLFGR
jgi:integrase